MIEDRCKERVFPKEHYGAFHGYQCHKNIWKDGFCKIHHPESVAARQNLSMKRWEAKRGKDPLSLAYKKIDELEEIIRDLRAKVEITP